MVGNDRNGVRSALEIMFPLREGEDYCQKFMVVDVIVAFSGGKGLGEVSARMEITVCVLLHKYGTCGEQRCIGYEVERSGYIGNGENGGGGKNFFERVKGSLLRRSPSPRDVFLSESGKRSDDVGVVGDEFSVEVGKA